MRPSSRLLRAALQAAAVVVTLVAGAQGAVDVLSYHGGNLSSDGVNSAETSITASNVNTLQKLFTTDITDVPNVTGIPTSTLPSGIDYTSAAGQVYAQPLLKTSVNITTGNYKGVHDVVFVATSMNSLFAIDATGGTVLWKDSFIYNASGNPNPVNTAIGTGITAVPGGFGTETNSQDVSPWIGILSTPVIDPVNGYIYLTAKTREARTNQNKPHYVYRLHKVRMADGLDVSTIIADTQLTSSTTYTFTSGPYVSGSTASDAVSGKLTFNAVRQMIRPGLKIYNNRVYIASASHGDNQPYHGWILTYSADSTATAPVLNGVWNSTPNGKEGGVWQGGGSVVIDSNGYIYFETGNGTFDGTSTGNVVSGLDASGFPASGDYGDCFVKLALDSTTTQASQNKNGWGLKVADYFSPYDNQALSSNDTDLGAGGPTILPDSAGSAAHPHLLTGAGKAGKLYLLDRDNLGKFAASDALAVQTVAGSINACFSTTGFFNGRVYATSGFGGTMASWPLANATITTGGIQNTPDQIAFPGCSPSFSANGTAGGITWLIDKGTGQLRAYDASNIATELWTSNLNATRDSLGNAVKFSVPVPANGRVYAGTADHLVVYSLPAPPTAGPVAPSGLKIVSASPSTITLSWTDNSSNEDGFAIERSSDSVNFTQVGTAGVNQTTFADSGLSSQATYYYRVRAFNSFNTISYSAYTSIASGATTSLNSQTPVNLYHFDEGAGTATVDSVSANNGTLIGTLKPGWTSPGRVGSSNLSFSGDGQYLQTGESAVQVGADLSPTLGATSSLLFWVKTTQVGSGTTYQAPAVTGVEQSGNDSDIGWGYLDANGRIGLWVGNNGSVLSADPVNDGNWHHVALSRDASSGNVKVYIDGALDSSVTLEAGAKTSQFKLIGALSDVAGDGTTFQGANFFNGQLDDVQIYNVVIDPAVVAAIALPPAAPTNLTVTPYSGTELDLSWTDNASNESGYNVWTSVSGGAWTKIASLAANATAYANTGLTQNTTYSYFVEAVNSAGYADSNTVTVTTPAPPLTPSNATVTYLSPTEIDLTWTDNANNETGYRVLRSVNSGTYAQVASFGPDATAYQDLNIQAGAAYSYHIQAYNVAGYSDFAGRTVTAPAQSQYLSYLAGYGLTTQAATATTADPDGDGISNLLEYAFASDPTHSSVGSLPVVGTTGGYLSITFTQQIPPTDLYYTVQVSSDMVTWTSGATTQVSVTPINATTQQVTVRDNVPLSSGASRFIRVSVKH